MFSKFLYVVSALFLAVCLETFGIIGVIPYTFTPIVGVAAGLFAMMFFVYARGTSSIGY